MKKIRHGCFETNSSSMHNICIMKHSGVAGLSKEELAEKLKDENVWGGKLHLYGLSKGFGRSPFRVLTSFRDKLKYAMCAYMGYLYIDDPKFDEYQDMFDDLVADIMGEQVGLSAHETELDIYEDEDGNELLYKQLEYESTDKDGNRIYTYVKGAEKHFAKLTDKYWIGLDVGMIDHQSMGLLQNFLRKENVTLKEFLTNDKYVIIIDGDEYCEFENLCEAGLINMDNIEKIFKGDR